jgi:hypothetical protein
VTPSVEPVYRCLGQAGHGVVKATVGDVGVGGGGRGVAQKFLHFAQVGAALEQAGGKGVAQSMGGTPSRPAAWACLLTSICTARAAILDSPSLPPGLSLPYRGVSIS